MLSDRFHVAVVACDLAGDLVPLSKAEWCELQDVQIQMHRLYNNACEQIMLQIIYAFARFADEAA